MLRATVAGATDGEIVAGHCENRSRRLGRNARDLAVDEVVDHQISNADDGMLGNELQRVFEIEQALSLDDLAVPAAVTDSRRWTHPVGARWLSI